VNYLDREFRKDIAAFRRESTRFTRNVSNGALRFAIYQVWHNFVKPWRIKHPWPPFVKHGDLAGLPMGQAQEGLRSMLSERAFLSRLSLGEEARRIWLKLLPTPLKARPDYLPAFASA
jgi:hypothetical protein